MTHINQLQIEDFNYQLPNERIAKYPLAQRDLSKLLIYQNNVICEDIFRNLKSYLQPGTLIVFNNTKVIPARLLFKRSTGALIEIFCLEPHTPSDYQLILNETKTCVWKCLVGNLKKWKEEFLEKRFNIQNQAIQLKAKIVENQNNCSLIEFSWNNEISFNEILEFTGNIPIPPYLNRESEESDKTNYQTIYSKNKGSVAAPTAGLHFTDSVLKDLTEKQILSTELTLHVGAGTFQPVKSKWIKDHEMHAEFFEISSETIDLLIDNYSKIFAVGTTSLRTLESVYWIGRKIGEVKNQQLNFTVNQWEPYEEMVNPISGLESLRNIAEYMQEYKLKKILGKTKIIITPGYQFRIINGLITNFHQPESTLLLLVAAIIGPNWKDIYSYALSNNFRFLSYGDSSILFL